VVVEICLLVCLTLRGLGHIQNLCGFLTPTTMVQSFIMTCIIFRITLAVQINANLNRLKRFLICKISRFVNCGNGISKFLFKTNFSEIFFDIVAAETH
jgi:hypothetical protein